MALRGIETFISSREVIPLSFANLRIKWPLGVLKLAIVSDRFHHRVVQEG